MKKLQEYLLDATDSALMAGEEAPFQATLHTGVGRMAVVAGSNASGKSLYVRILASRASSAGVLPISISIRERTGSGQEEMSSMRRAMMFGDESEQSTGATSVGTVRRGFSNLTEHAKDRPALLILDEPEMGLSEDYAAAMGQWIAQETQKLSHDNEVGVIVVTHSRALVRALSKAMEANQQPVHFVGMEREPSLEAWLNTHEARSVEDLLALPGLGNQRRRTVSSIIESRKKKPSNP